MHLKVVAQGISKLCTFTTVFPVFGLILENGLKTEKKNPSWLNRTRVLQWFHIIGNVTALFLSSKHRR